ncbi:MAG: hypothetical protein PHC61_03380 [Chitinivibrionales bacterium]|nr:hypothetical protein [Chitinivibrionales bacterium]
MRLSTHDYALKIQKAVPATGLNDPYTGQLLRWDLIGTWDSKKKIDRLRAMAAKPRGFNNDLYLLPTIDHKSPAAQELDIEICSLRINCCKGSLNPDEFVALCKQVVDFKAKSRQISKSKKQRRR